MENCTRNNQLYNNQIKLDNNNNKIKLDYNNDKIRKHEVNIYTNTNITGCINFIIQI